MDKILGKLRDRTGVSQHPTTGGKDADLTIRCSSYQNYVPSGIKGTLSKTDINCILRGGCTTQYELHTILQDPNFGILPSILKDSIKHYESVPFDKQTQAAHIKDYLDLDPFGSMGIDPSHDAMWNPTFHAAYKKYLKAVRAEETRLAKAKESGTNVIPKRPIKPSKYYSTTDASQWSRMQSHLRYIQDDCYFRAISFLPKMAEAGGGARTRVELLKQVDAWYELMTNLGLQIAHRAKVQIRQGQRPCP